MDIRQVLNMIKRWVWLFLLGAIIAGAAGYEISRRETPLYQTSSRFILLWAPTSGMDSYSRTENQRLIATYSELLTTSSLIEQASINLGFIVDPGMASAAQIGDTQFIRLTVTHPEPEKAAAIANTLIDVLIEQNEQLQSVRYRISEENLNTSAEHALEQIDSIQNELQELSSTSVQEQIERVEQQVDLLQPQLVELQTQVTELETALLEFRPTFASEEDLAINESQRNLLPIVQAELDQIRSILALYQEIYTNLFVMQAPLQTEGESSSSITRLQTNLDLYHQVYLNSISSLETISLARAQNAPNVVQVEPAKVPLTPISPKPMQTALYAGIFGFVMMAGIAFLIEYLDDTLKTPDDIKNTLGLPVVGLIADIPTGGLLGKKTDNSIFVDVQPRSPISEAFRSMRTNLEFASIDHPLKTILITSSGPKEGKTIIASNLAGVLAQNNKKVLLIDADLRRPKIHKQFDLSNRVGLSDLIREKLTLDEVIQTSKISDNLSIITSGLLPPNPVELLASNRMMSIIELLKTKFDMVIFDTPPMLVTDAQVLSSRIDGVLFVIRPGKTSTAMARAPLEELHHVDANLLGVVMNRIPRNREFYYGGLNYYSPYTVDPQYHLTEDEEFFNDNGHEQNDNGFFEKVRNIFFKTEDEN